MTVFKAFLRVVNKNKAPIIMYTIILIFFGGFNMQNKEQSPNFISSKPDIYIINHDDNKGITNSLIKYMGKNSNIKKIDENKLEDAIFYRDINYLIEIPENYNDDFMLGKNPEIKIKTTNDYPAVQANNLLERYLKTAYTYRQLNLSESELIAKIEETLNKEISVELSSKLNTNNLSSATTYYNFLNYCLLAGTIYVITLVLTSFKNESVKKRTLVSSMNYKKFNRDLLISNGLFAFILWILYIILSFILVGNVMFTPHGLLYILNSFVFTICALTIAFLIGTLMSNKDAINGIVNVIGLGSSFLCGSFVPMAYLPSGVLAFAHILPSYYFIKNNEIVLTLEKINLTNIKPIIINMLIILLFSLIFIILTNVVSRYKRKIG